MQSIALLNLTSILWLGFHSVVLAQQPHVHEIPLPKGATDLSYMKSRGDVRMKVAGDMKQAGEFYQTELTQKQWIKSTKDNLQKTFWVQTFSKQNLEIVVRTSNIDGGGSDIRLTPKGYLWDEDFTPHPEDIPIPENAIQLSYNELFSAIEFQHKDSPRKLVDFYKSKLDAKTWQPTNSSIDRVDEESGVIMRSSGIASLVIYVDVDGDKSKVQINTKGMSWDQIKLANAKAKKIQEASPGTSASGSNGAPGRMTKPKRGIESLEKLPSTASVTIDGKKTLLTEIFAFELISYGTWRTHIVATAQPVKQDALLKLLQANVPEEKWGEQWRLPSPNVVLILDEDDSLRSVQLYADKVPGSSTSVTGEAMVENGRARGKAKLSPQKFFEHCYEAEISFDTPLLNPGAAPRSLLANAPKLENSGEIMLAGRTFPLPYVTAYEERKGDRTMFHVVLTEKPIDSEKILASLKKSGEVGMGIVGFQTHIDFTIDGNDTLSSMSLWCDGASVTWSGNDKIQSLVQSEGSRVRGTSKTIAKEEVFGKSFEFQASFDTSILRASSSK